MKRISVFVIALAASTASAQTDSDPFGSDYNFDSTSYSDSSYDYNYEYDYNESPEQPAAPQFKKYERFKPPIDTITNLVTYTGIVPFTPLMNDVYDGGTIDSLYWRAKKFLMQKYMKDYREKAPKDMVFPKDLLIEDFRPDGENGRVIIRPTVPLYVKNNSFSKTPMGTLTFRIEIRVKEEKYKYKFSHFVHNTVEKGTEKPIKTYAEFYANNTRGFKGTDQILIAIDNMVKEIVKELAKIMKDPVVIDPDDF